MWVGLFRSCYIPFTSLLGRYNILLRHTVSENAVIERVTMWKTTLPSIPILLLLESASPAATGTGTCRCRPDIEVQRSSRPLPLQCMLLCLPHCSDCAPGVTIKGVNLQSMILPPQTFLTVLKLAQKLVYKSLVLKSGVFCLDGWEFISLSGLMKEFNSCSAWSAIRHIG